MLLSALTYAHSPHSFITHHTSHITPLYHTGTESGAAAVDQAAKAALKSPRTAFGHAFGGGKAKVKSASHETGDSNQGESDLGKSKSKSKSGA